jgi:hypothetical protein
MNLRYPRPRHGNAAMLMTLAAMMGGGFDAVDASPEEREADRKRIESDRADRARHKVEQEERRRAEREAIAAPLRAERLARKRAAFAKRNGGAP